jgi:HEXXH motif-containing protein
MEDISHIAAFAAVAALEANHYFDLPVPVRSGNLYLPNLGSIAVDNAEGNGWARVISDRSGVKIFTGAIRPGTLNAPLPKKAVTLASLKPTARLHAEFQGLPLNVILDDSDPFLSRLGPISAPLTVDSIREWQTSIDKAWAILVSHHWTAAQALSSVVTTLVPLFEPTIDHPISAVSGWAWGAVALSLPSDPFSLAETLIHELRHLLLSAVEDIASLVDNEDNRLFYSPWRNDPRSISSLFQATYAFSGVMDFWQKHRNAAAPALRRRAELAFALERVKIPQAIDIMRDSTALTSAGHFFIAKLENRVMNKWLKQPVTTSVEAVASEIATEHHLRWRLTNLVPEKRTVRTLADAWMAKLQISVDQTTSSKTKAPSSAVPSLRDRSRLLERQFLILDSRVDEIDQFTDVDAADDALLRGEDVRARDEYLRQVSEGRQLDAWIGLMLALRRLGVMDESLSTSHPIEIIVAVHQHIRSRLGEVPDIQALVLWIVGALGPR